MKRFHFSIWPGLVFLFAIGCAELTPKSATIEPGMSKSDVISILGKPDSKEMKGSAEALKYSEHVGYAQCSFITVLLDDDKTISITQSNGLSVFFTCMGSQQVDWKSLAKKN